MAKYGSNPQNMANRIGETSGERKIFPSANPVNLSFRTNMHEQIL